jgi:hypothetical protein
MRRLLLSLAVALIITVAHGQTIITGGIYSDTTWSHANSPFIIYDTVIIHGVTLTIQPGVTVKFQNNGLLQARNNGGRILASGTAADSITFTSNSTSPHAGIYSGIAFDWWSARISIFNYCNFFYADNAIKDGAYWDSLSVKHSVFRYNNTGLNKGSWGPQLNIIDSCVFRNNTDYGLYDLYDSKISHCIIESNRIGLQYGSQVQIEYSDIYANLTGICGIESCIIDHSAIHNNQSGLSFDNISNGNWVYNSFFENNQYGILDTMVGNALIRNCYVRYNQYGLTCKNDTNTTVDSCFILHNQHGILNDGKRITIMNSRVDSNTVAGIHFRSLAENCSVIHCDIKNNPSGLIDEAGLSPNLFTRNIIDNNNIGINFKNSIDNFYCNRICNNSSYALKYTGANNISFSNNYWCTADSVSTASVIFDGHDTIGAGYVHFLPLDTINCYLCNYNFIAITFTCPSCSGCTDGTATANVYGTPPFSYLWNTTPSQTTQTATGLTTGIYYTVCVTDSVGCTGCDSVYFSPETSVHELPDNNCLSIYPNPFSAQGTLHTDKPVRNATLTMYNCFGQRVAEIMNISGQTITIRRDNLPGGVYFVHLIQDNRIIATKKLIITD